MTRSHFPLDEAIRRRLAASADDALRFSRDGSLRAWLGIADAEVAPAAPPHDWSDTLYSAAAEPHVQELWRLGVLETLFFHAQATRPDGCAEQGRIGESSQLRAQTHLKPEVLKQAFEFETSNLAAGPLAHNEAGRFDWQGHAQPVNSLFRAALRQLDLKSSGYNVAILVPCLETGGAELVALWHYRAAEALGLRPVLIPTDRPIVTKRFASAELINIPALIEDLGLTSHNLAIEQHMLCLAQVLRAVDPDIVHLVHSWSGYNLFGSRLFRRLFDGRERLLVSAFCPHIHENGQVEGYFRHIPRIDDIAGGYVCDTQWYADELVALNGLAGARVHALRYPVEPSEAAAPPVERARKVLWASRLDFQKNPTIVFDIARQLPDHAFDIWGRVVLSDEEIDWKSAPENVTYRGPFYSLDDIPIEDYAAFLYTAKFDGMPNIVLEIARAGLPIVTSSVGGIPEFIDAQVGRLIAEPTDAAAYVAALQELLSDSDLRLRMSRAIVAKVRKERLLDSFVAQVAALPAYTKRLAALRAGRAGAEESVGGDAQEHLCPK